MTFQTPRLQTVERPLQSLLALGRKERPEIAAFACVDPVETAADKLSALAWRVCTRKRGAEDDDPTVVRHLHDLASLEWMANESPDFRRLVWQAMESDTGRGGGRRRGSRRVVSRECSSCWMATICERRSTRDSSMTSRSRSRMRSSRLMRLSMRSGA